MTQDHWILIEIAAAFTSMDELSSLGIGLGCDPRDVSELKQNRNNIKDVAYEILSSFYYSPVPKEERWMILIKTLGKLNKNMTVKKLRLEERHKDAQNCRWEKSPKKRIVVVADNRCHYKQFLISSSISGRTDDTH